MLITLAFPAALALPLWRYLGPFSCGGELTFGYAVFYLSSPVLALGGLLLLIVRKPRGVGFWAVGVAVGLPFWVFALYSTGCEV